MLDSPIWEVVALSLTMTQRGGTHKVVWTNGIKAKLKEHGMTMHDIALFLGICDNSVSKKINNITEFKASEIGKMSDLLEIYEADIGKYFFTKEKD